MRQIMQFFSEEYKSEDESAAFIQNHFNIYEIVLTKGSKGARYFIGDRNYGFSAVPIEIADTVGSGDSFLAGFLSKRIRGEITGRNYEAGCFFRRIYYFKIRRLSGLYTRRI